MEIAIYCVIMVLALAALILLIYWPKIQKMKEKTDKQKSDDSIEKIEKAYTKKCIHCGEKIPLENQICPSCNKTQEP